MRRRTLIRHAGAAASAAAVTGCLHGDRDPEDQPEPDDRDDVEPQLLDTTFETEGSFTGVHRDEATVEYTTSTVEIDGAIAGSNGCYTAELAGAEHDTDEDSLVVHVEAVEDRDEDEECTDEPVAVEYGFTAEFEGGLPAVVEVRHDGRTAVHAERGSHIDVDGGVEHTEFTVLQVENTDEEVDDGEIEFQQDRARVEVNGRTTGSDGCKTAALDTVEYDAGEDQVSLDVVTRDREDAEACTQALVEIKYRARIYFDDEVPQNASVAHDGDASFGASWASDSASAPE